MDENQLGVLLENIKVIKNFIFSTDEELNNHERRIKDLEQKVAYL